MEALIFIGIPGSGKTTYYREHFASTHTHISLDVVGTREREDAMIRESLAAKRPFVIDNTNITRADRARYIARAKAAGYRVAGYFFPTEVRTAIGRNNHRTDKKALVVPAILRSYKRLEPPTLDEGFDALEEVVSRKP